MTGVDILAMEEVAVEWAFNWTWFWILLGVGIVIGAFTGWKLYYDEDCSWGVIPALILFLGVVGAIVGAILGSAAGVPTKYEPQYKVTVSDDVSMTEFLERYEIIDTEGKIYTVREKNNEE